MSVGWVAVAVRARAMTRRRLGHGGTRRLAAAPTLAAAVTTLTRSPYGHDVDPGQGLAQAQRAVVASMVWNVRVLAGWAPREGVGMLRVLLGSLEADNIDDQLRRLTGAEVPPPYRLGGLDTAWSRVARAGSVGEVRRALAASPWGDPGSDEPDVIGLAVRSALPDRVMAAVPLAAAWAAGAAALLVAREVVLAGRELPPAARVNASRVLGFAALDARTLSALTAVLPAAARWALADVTDPQDLWRAEARWWTRVERDAWALSRHVGAGPEALVGAVALLAVDAWRVRGALEVAAAHGAGLGAIDGLESVDALA